MLSGKSKILRFVLSVAVALGCSSVPAFASGSFVMIGCAGAQQDQNPQTPPPNTGTAVPPVYDYTDVNSYNFYFGQLSAHSNQSDGTGSVDGAFLHARDAAKLDFFALTDNSNMFDNGANATLANGNVSSEWKAGKAAADYYTNSKFVGIYGFEMAWANGNGHINTYNTEGFETSAEPSYSGANGLLNYYITLKQYPSSLSQFNHPGTNGDFVDYGYYDPQLDTVVSLIEVASGEGKPGSAQYYPSYAEYTRALDSGWHLAPTNNQDNRQSLYGDANNARTVVLAKSLSRSEIFNAIKNRRVYATEDKNLKIRYSLNGQIMGSVLSTKPASAYIRADIEDTDGEAIGTVSVITNGGRVVQSQTLAVSRYTLNISLPADYSYYYIRVDQADKDIAVTAPVWIAANAGPGIAKTYFNTNSPKAGETLKIISEVCNNGSYDMVLSSIVYKANGSAVATLQSPGTVRPGSTGRFSIDYTPPSDGRVRIDVTVKAAIQGVERVYSDTATLDVAKSDSHGTIGEAVKTAIQLIDKIKFNGRNLKADVIKTARSAYDALTAEQKNLVTNYDRLLAAEAWIQWMDNWGKYLVHGHGKKS